MDKFSSGWMIRRMKTSLPAPDPVLVGRRLEALRHAEGDMSQKEFAAVIGVDDSSYTKIKAGDKALKSDMGFRAAERFAVSMDYLYRGDVSRIEEPRRSKIIAYLAGHTR